MAVDQHQNAVVRVSQTSETAHSNEAVIAIVGDVEAAHALQNVGQRAVAILLDLVRRDYRDRRGRIAGALQVLRGAVNLYVPQFFQARFPEVLRLFLGGGGYRKHE